MTTLNQKTKTTKNLKKKPETVSQIPFSRASKKDVYKVTVNLISLVGLLGSEQDIKDLQKGETFNLHIESPSSRVPVQVAFTVNREGQTAATNGWPIIFDQSVPEVGYPVFLTVDKAVFVG